LVGELGMSDIKIVQSFSPNFARDGRLTFHPASTNSVRAGRQVCRPSRAELGLKDWANAVHYIWEHFCLSGNALL
jgi:hypothetical protein